MRSCLGAALLLDPLSTRRLPLGLFSADVLAPPGELAQAQVVLDIDPGAALAPSIAICILHPDSHTPSPAAHLLQR